MFLLPVNLLLAYLLLAYLSHIIIFTNGKAKTNLNGMRWKRPILAATTAIASQFIGIVAIFNCISVSKLAAAPALQFLQSKKRKLLQLLISIIRVSSNQLLSP